MLVLSLFPGIGLLDRAFEQEGFCVVRGPDLLWGGDIKTFHPPAGKFDGVIGGPPCKRWSRLSLLNHAQGHDLAPDLIPEYERVVAATRPTWFLMENVPEAPVPEVRGYQVTSVVLNNRWLGAEQHRVRRFCFGTRDGRDLRQHIQLATLESFSWQPTVCASSGGKSRPGALRKNGKLARPGRAMLADRSSRSLPEAIRLQGLPDSFLKDAPFTSIGKREAIGNGVPLPMGLAIARAVKQALA